MRHVVLAVLLALGLSAAARADDFSLDVTNNSGEDVTSIVANPKEAAEPGANLLSAALEPGDSQRLIIQGSPGACLYDLVITFAGGHSRTRGDTDLCSASGFIIE